MHTPTYLCRHMPYLWVLTPNFGRYVPRQSGKWARAPYRAPGRAWICGAPERAWAVLSLKMRGSGTSLIRFERENASRRNCQEESGWRSGRLLTRGAAERFAFGLSRQWEAMNGLKLKKCLKIMVSGTAKSEKKCKIVMLRNGFFW